MFRGFVVNTGRRRTASVELGRQGGITRNGQVFAGYAKLDRRSPRTTSGAPAPRPADADDAVPSPARLPAA